MRRVKRSKKRPALVVFALGVLAGAGILTPAYIHARSEAQAWKELQAGTRDSWLEDRRQWADGKPFQYHHGRHHHRW